MKCVSALSTSGDTGPALAEVLGRARLGLGDEAGGDLAVVFSTLHHAAELGAIGRAILDRGLARVVIGCTGESIIGEGREIEGAAALGLWVLSCPGIELQPLKFEHTPAGFRGWPTDFNDRGEAILLLGDPFSFPADEWLAELRERRPGMRVFGGMASAGRAAGQNRVMLDGASDTGGAVGVVIDGPVWVREVVSQGCRPIGRPFVITRAEGNMIQELGGLPTLQRLQEVFDELEEADRRLVLEGLHVGRVVDEFRDTFRRGDFLVRNVMGADRKGALALGEAVKVGQTVQFHVRDAATADEDLKDLLEQDALDHPSDRPAGALLFSCNGRGSRLFSEPDHDVSALTGLHGPIPVTGFFAMGEIGPIGGRNYVHGYTASVALFGPARGD